MKFSVSGFFALEYRSDNYDNLKRVSLSVLVMKEMELIGNIRCEIVIFLGKICFVTFARLLST